MIDLCNGDLDSDDSKGSISCEHELTPRDEKLLSTSNTGARTLLLLRR